MAISPFQFRSFVSLPPAKRLMIADDCDVDAVGDFFGDGEAYGGVLAALFA